MKKICLCAFLLLSFAVRGDFVIEESMPLTHDRFSTHKVIDIEGYEIELILPDGMTNDQAEDLVDIIARLTYQLEVATAILPHPASSKLRSKVHFYVDNDCSDGGRVFFLGYYDEAVQEWVGRVTFNCFRFAKNILAQIFQGGEEVNGNQIWGNKRIVIHELAHAWHYFFVVDGYDNQMIDDFYQHALTCFANESGSSYYWEQNVQEFYAEFTGMYYLSHWAEPKDASGMHWYFSRMIRSTWNDIDYSHYAGDIARGCPPAYES